MPPTKKKSPASRESLISAYMTATMESGSFPVSVFRFCREQRIGEEEFYAHFGSLESLQKEIWVAFYEQTHARLEQDDNYASYSNREKILGFFYTFFELLTLNRSYILFALGRQGSETDQLRQLSGLRRKVREYARELLGEGKPKGPSRVARHQQSLFAEGTWVQALFLLRFWMRDDSPGFEKTDMAIEKSVNTIFDIFDNTPLERVIDFGKFLFKEHLS